MLKKMTHMVFPMILMLQACLFTYAHADASAAVVPERRENGMLYKANCAICHGQAKRGQASSLIENAIRKNTGGMGSLRFLTQEQIRTIADF
ncbi:c-type cytochrome [Geotalea toluenoxydans]|uniref:c-type cytochrome n=1 Tax=Geotalea toluenoxydans TaxID=421624 RepID=UPI0006D2090A|nr:cytochrome c [Geotalea toluenoxydans]